MPFDRHSKISFGVRIPVVLLRGHARALTVIRKSGMMIEQFGVEYREYGRTRQVRHGRVTLCGGSPKGSESSPLPPQVASPAAGRACTALPAPCSADPQARIELGR